MLYKELDFVELAFEKCKWLIANTLIRSEIVNITSCYKSPIFPDRKNHNEHFRHIVDNLTFRNYNALDSTQN